MPYKPKNCPNCDTQFTPKAPSQQYCRREVTHPCPECENIIVNICTQKAHMKTFCSHECANKSTITKQNRADTMQEKYGVQNIMHSEEYVEKVQATQKLNNNGKLAFNSEKQKQTMTERYGGPSPMYDETIRKKVETTQKLNNNGVYAFNTPKQKETMIERYGSPGILGNPEEYKKHEEIMLKTYGVKKISSDPEWSQKIIAKIIENHGQLFGNKTISNINKKFAQQLETHGHQIEYEKRIQNNLFDIYIQHLNLLIEINPTVTHNSTLPFACLRVKCAQPCPNHAPKPQNYHYRRALLAKNNGYSLIQIYDWDNPDFILAKINNKARTSQTTVRASKLEVKTITQKTANDFLHENHLQGGSKQQTHCYGLYTKEQELVSVMTFSKPRFAPNYEYELNRFATKLNHKVYGAASKLFKAFATEVNPTSVISYVDFNHTTSKTTYLNHLNFTEKDPTGPTLIWSKLRSPKIVKQTSLNKQGADRLLGTSYGKEYTNEEIMLLEKYVKIYTAGNRVYTWTAPADK